MIDKGLVVSVMVRSMAHDNKFNVIDAILDYIGYELRVA